MLFEVQKIVSDLLTQIKSERKMSV